MCTQEDQGVCMSFTNSLCLKPEAQIDCPECLVLRGAVWLVIVDFHLLQAVLWSARMLFSEYWSASFIPLSLPMSFVCKAFDMLDCCWIFINCNKWHQQSRFMRHRIELAFHILLCTSWERKSEWPSLCSNTHTNTKPIAAVPLKDTYQGWIILSEHDVLWCFQSTSHHTPVKFH